MDIQETVRLEVNIYKSITKESNNRIAQQAGISRSSISTFMRGKTKLEGSSLKKLRIYVQHPQNK